MLCQWTTIIPMILWHSSWYFWCLNEIVFDGGGCNCGIIMLAYFNTTTHFSFCFIVDNESKKNEGKNMIIAENTRIYSEQRNGDHCQHNESRSLIKSVEWLHCCGCCCCRHRCCYPSSGLHPTCIAALCTMYMPALFGIIHTENMRSFGSATTKTATITTAPPWPPSQPLPPQ